MSADRVEDEAGELGAVKGQVGEEFERVVKNDGVATELERAS